MTGGILLFLHDEVGNIGIDSEVGMIGIDSDMEKVSPDNCVLGAICNIKGRVINSFIVALKESIFSLL